MMIPLIMEIAQRFAVQHFGVWYSLFVHGCRYLTYGAAVRPNIKPTNEATRARFVHAARQPSNAPASQPLKFGTQSALVVVE